MKHVNFALAALASTCLLSALPATAQEQRGGQCRQEVRAACPDVERSQMRQCIAENMSKLSETCQTQIKERQKARANGERRPRGDGEGRRGPGGQRGPGGGPGGNGSMEGGEN